MATVPETRYARSGDVHIAYQVVGDGPIDIVFVPGFVSNLDAWWQEPLAARFFTRLASFARVLLFDKRGTGLSDPVPLDQLPTLEQRMDDVRAVMDAAGSERAALIGLSEGGPMTLLFAATHPGRTQALVLVGSSARFCRAPDAPWGWPPAYVEGALAIVESKWGTGAMFSVIAPTLAANPTTREWVARFERASASPGAAAALIRMIAEIDTRSVLHAISAPTLVVHRTHDSVLSLEHAHDLTRRIAGARLATMPGSDHFFMGPDVDDVARHIEEFVTGAHGEAEPDRVLATVLFTDIVGSTSLAAGVGDARWRDLLERHDALVDGEVRREAGRRVKHTGDGVLAAFDGPAKAVRCARAVIEHSRALGFDVRAGVHTGECHRRGDDLSGIAVHIGARVGALAEAG
ncbi:MAG: adenylate/guanylate cyclase domain-containing protein, partial [Acidimicrobiia bacterium]